MAKKSKLVWITWENQRRSIELAGHLGCNLFIITPGHFFSKVRLFKYISNSIRTVWILLRVRPNVLFVQNPSMILNLISLPLKKIFRFILIVDRHTNFKLDQLNNNSIFWKFYFYLSKITVKYSDLTIVTNDFLAKLVENYGGRSFVLQDKIPDMKLGMLKKLKGKKNIVFISTFSDDEPIDEVIRAARLIGYDFFIYITGRPTEKYLSKSREADFPSNIILTGYLREPDYQSLLFSADVLLVLTKNDYTLTCGTYEGISLKKCLVISDTSALRSYFNKGMVYVQSTSESIAAGIVRALDSKLSLEEEINLLKNELVHNWEERFEFLVERIRSFSRD